MKAQLWGSAASCWLMSFAELLVWPKVFKCPAVPQPFQLHEIHTVSGKLALWLFSLICRIASAVHCFSLLPFTPSGREAVERWKCCALCSHWGFLRRTTHFVHSTKAELGKRWLGKSCSSFVHVSEPVFLVQR